LVRREPAQALGEGLLRRASRAGRRHKWRLCRAPLSCARQRGRRGSLETRAVKFDREARFAEGCTVGEEIFAESFSIPSGRRSANSHFAESLASSTATLGERALCRQPDILPSAKIRRSATLLFPVVITCCGVWESNPSLLGWETNGSTW